MKVFYDRGTRIGVLEADGKEQELESAFVRQNLESGRKMKDRDLWKTSGRGARFLGVEDTEPERKPEVTMEGLASLPDGRIAYAVTIDGMSAVYEKEPSDPDAEERHIVHGMDRRIRNLTYADGLGWYICSATDDGLRYQLVFLDPDSADDRTVTEGDIVADHPFFDGETVLFNCFLIGRDGNGNVAGYSPSRILSVHPETLALEEVLAEPDFSLTAPKRDRAGNLYYLRRPPVAVRKKSNLFLDIVLFPYRVIKAFVNCLNTFSMLYGGESLRKDGGMERSKQKNDRELLIEGNLINVRRTMRENAKNSPHPGVIPRSWSLMRRSADGNQTEVLAKGVLAYDVTPEGEVVYSNGKHLFLQANGSERHLCACEMAKIVAIARRKEGCGN